MIFSYSSVFLIRWSLGVTRQISSFGKDKTARQMAAAVFFACGSSKKEFSNPPPLAAKFGLRLKSIAPHLTRLGFWSKICGFVQGRAEKGIFHRPLRQKI